MASKALPTPEMLRQLLDYDPETGSFVWRRRDVRHFQDTKTRPAKHNAANWNAKHANRPAFVSRSSTGYLSAGIFNVTRPAHRIAWAIHYGEWPDGEIDHINGDRTDNRIANLRDISRAENCRNSAKRSSNTSGVNGVSWHKPTQKWQARADVDGKSIYLGRFKRLEDAVSARKAAEVTLGFTERHGV